MGYNILVRDITCDRLPEVPDLMAARLMEWWPGNTANRQRRANHGIYKSGLFGFSIFVLLNNSRFPNDIVAFMMKSMEICVDFSSPKLVQQT